MKKEPLQLFTDILDNIRYYIYAVDPATDKIIYANRAFTTAFGDGAIGQKSSSFIPLSNDNIAQTPGWPVQLEDLLRDNDLTFYDLYIEERAQWLSASRQTVRWINGKDVYLVNCYDNTSHKNNEAEIRTQAFHDYLTGLPNRHACEDALRNLLRDTADDLSPGFLFFIDLDDFKIVNDSHGHDYGDAVLISFADFLRRTFTGKNKIFRLGGDEFVVLISHANYLNVPEYLETMLDRAKQPWPAVDKEFYCSLSIGVVEFISCMEYSGSLLKKADIAMYHAKKMGKNCYAYYTQAMDEETMLRSTMEPLLREAIKNNFAGFEILYQPYCAANDSRVIGAKALLRLKAANGSLILPKNFLDLLEYLGLMVQVNEHVLASAAALCRDINKAKPDFCMTVNLSPVQFKHKDGVKRIEEILKQSGVNLNNIIVAVNEKMAMDERKRILGLCSEFRQHGIRVALDDFGAGNASFINMRRLPVDMITVAPAFVSNPEDDFTDRFLHLIIELGHISKKQICLSGIETASQLEFARSRGADLVQGFFLYTPGDESILRALMLEA